MTDAEELLESGRPRPSRRRLVTALTLAALAGAGVLIAHARSGSSPGRPQGVASGSASKSVSGSSSATPPQPVRPAPRAWPTAAGACGATPELPIVTSTAPRERTGITVLVGSAGVRRVDFDAGTDAVVRTGMDPGEYVWDLVSATDSYALTSTCGPGRQRVVRIGAPGGATPAPLYGAILSDGTHAWLAAAGDGPHSHGWLQPLDGGRRVTLPAEFFPSDVTGGVLVGAMDSRIVSVDLRTGAVRGLLGVGDYVTAGAGTVLWTEGCDLTLDRPCSLLRRSVGGGGTTRYRLPRPPSWGGAALSADGTRLALTLQRAAADPRFANTHPLPPADVDVIDLGTGAVQRVPGIEIPPKSALGLVFSADGKWVVAALDAGDRIRVLAWRPGLTRPYETRAVPGAVYAAPAVALPSR
jgi:hypothetical protein